MEAERLFLNEQEQMELAQEIIVLFEEFLEAKEITIDNPEKQGVPDASTIYGSDYGMLEEKIITMLRDYKVVPRFEECKDE